MGADPLSDVIGKALQDCDASMPMEPHCAYDERFIADAVRAHFVSRIEALTEKWGADSYTTFRNMRMILLDPPPICASCALSTLPCEDHRG